MKASISVVDGKSVLSTVEMVRGSAGQSAHVKAIPGGKYILAEGDQGFAPEKVILKRVGKNLHVALKGTDPNNPELVIEDFFENEGQLVGMGEDGVYHEYVSVDGDDDGTVGFLVDGATATHALGAAELAGFEYASVLLEGGVIPTAALGLGALGLLGGAAAGLKNKGGGKKSPVVAPPKNNGIDAVVDDVGTVQGVIKNGGVSDDARPTLSGSNQVPGHKVTITDGGVVIGEAVVDANGNWSYTPTTNLADGRHAFNVVVTDQAGRNSGSSAEYVVVIDTTAPTKPGAGDAVLLDDVGSVQGPIVNGAVTDDSTPTFKGQAEPGSTVVIYDNGQEIGRVIVGADGKWAFTPSTPLADGPHSLNYSVVDQAGNASEKSDPINFAVDTVAPAKPDAGDSSLIDDFGVIKGPISNGDVTDDNTPTFKGQAEPGSTVVIYDNGKEIGRVPADDTGKWEFTPSTPLVDGPHSLDYVVVDKAGNTSEKSDSINFGVDTVAPAKPGATDAGVLDDVGSIQGPIVNGDVTDDNTPTFKGQTEPGSTVVIYDNGKEIGRVPADDTGKWEFTPSPPLVDGPHSLDYTVVDKAGNTSEKSDSINFGVDTVAPNKPVIVDVFDDQGDETGSLLSGATTDDSKPTLTGTAEAGSIVVILDKGIEIGRTTADGSGNWSFEPSSPLSLGSHNLTAQAVDKAGNVSEASDEFALQVSPRIEPVVEDNTPVIIDVLDNQGDIKGSILPGASTDDTTPTIVGVGLAGQTISVFVDGVLQGTTVIEDSGNWSFTPSTALAEGEHNITATSTDSKGNVSQATRPYPLVVDTTAPTKPGADDAQLIDDVGTIQGPILNGGVTDDNTPTFKGQAEPGSTVVIYDDGKEIGRVPADDTGKWEFTPSTPLDDGPHSLEYEVVDSAGNVSPKSDPIVITVDTVAPNAPTIDVVFDDAGNEKGPLTSGDITDDAKPTLSGTAEAGSTVVIYDKGVEIGRTTADNTGKWTAEPTLPLALGAHELTAKSIDVAGNTSAPSNAFDLNLLSDAAPAAPSIGGVFDDVGAVQGNIQKNGVTDDSKPTVTGTAQAGMIVSVFVDGTLQGTTVADASGNWSFTPTTALTDGLHNITASATNGVGNVSPATGAYPIVVDTTAPSKPGANDAQLLDDVGAIQGPILNGGVTDDSTPTFKGQAEPGSTVIIYDKGTEIGRVPADDTGKWEFTPSTPLVDGPHSLDYAVVDKAGNTSEKSDPINFGVDTSKVVVSIEGAVDDFGSVQGPIAKGGVTDDTTPTLNGRATAGGTVKIYDGATLLGQTTADASGNWTFTPSTALSEGPHSLQATVTTAAQGESARTSGFDLTIDLTAPNKPVIDQVIDDVGSVQGALTNGQSTDDTTPTLKGQAEAGSTVKVFDKGSLLGSVTADAAGNWSFTPTTPLNNGPHDFTVVSTDKAGNASQPSDAFTVVIDTVAPNAPTIDNVFDDAGNEKGNLTSGGITDDAKPTLSGTAEAGSTVVIYDKGVEIGRTTADNTGKWTAEPTLPLGLGAHELTAKSIDAAGNSSAPSNTFDLSLLSDAPPSVPSIVGVLDDVGSVQGNIQKNGVTDDTKPTINGNAQAGTVVSVYIDGALQGTTVTDASGNWSFTPSTALTDGVHNITATATNAVGNVSPATGAYPIVVDTTAPSKPGANDAQLLDDVGAIQGPILNGGVTDDSTPTFKGQAEPGSTVIIYDKGTEIGRVPADDTGKWEFTPSTPLVDGSHSLEYAVVDKAGNTSEKSDPINFGVDTSKVVVSIEGAVDDFGSVQGPIAKGGVTDDTTPTLNGRATAGGTVKIYDGATLLGQTTADASGNWSFTPSTALSEGAHSLQATVTTAAQGESARTSGFDLTIDLTAPNKPVIDQVIDDVGSIQGALTNGQSTDDTTPTLKGQAEAGSTVKVFDKGSLLGSVTADASGNWSFTPTTPLNNGPHDFTVVSTDKAGNASQPSDAFTVVIDTVAPNAPTIDAVFDDAGNEKGPLTSGSITDDAKPTLSGTAEAGSTVVIYDKGVEIGRTTADNTGKWTAEPTLPLGLGAHELTAKSIDAAGNSSAPSNTFDLSLLSDAPPSVPSIVGVLDDVGSVQGNIQKNGVTDDTKPTINGNAQAGTVVSVYIDGALQGTTVTDASGNWSFTPSTALTDGVHNITATATNAVGNVSPATGAYPIVVDTTAPSKPGADDAQLLDDVGTIQGPILNGGVTDDSTPTFKGQAEPGSTVVVYNNGNEIGRVPADDTGKWQFTPSTPLADGPYSLNYAVVDKAGNSSPKSDAINFTVDTSKVVVSIEGAVDDFGSVQGPIAKGGVTDDTTPTLNGRATAGGTVKIYDGATLLGQTTADASGNWSFTPSTALSEGAHSLQATVTTAAQGESARTSGFDLNIDLTAPNKPVIDQVIDDVGSVQGALTNGQSTDDTTPTLKGQAEAGSTVKVFDKGSLLGSVTADAAGNWSFTPTTPLNNGPHDFTVVSTDKAGNASQPSDAFTVVIDTVAPNAPTIDNVFDDAGNETGNLTSGGITDDAKPTLSGTAEAGSTVVIYDKGVEIGRTTADNTGKWTAEPTLPLGLGAHELTAKSIDAAGNTSAPSNLFDLSLLSDAPPSVPSIVGVLDDVGSVQGNIQKNGVTDDTKPTINGNAQAGTVVSVYIDGALQGTTVTDASGNWSFTPSTALTDGVHNITATATNAVGNVSPATGAYPIVIDTTAPSKPGANDAQLLDDVGAIQGPILNGGVTDDSTPTFKGQAEPGSTVVVYNNGNEIGRVPADDTGKWQFTPSTPLADGPYSLNYAVVDKAGNSSPKSDAINFTVDTSKVVVSIEGAVDDFGSVQGPIAKGGVTDDTTPTLNGRATAGGTVKIYDGATLVGQTTADASGNWSFTPSTALSEGAHSLQATVTTAAQGESARTSGFDLTIDLTAPNKPVIDQVIDDVGSVQGALTNGQSTDDTTPTLKGQAEAGSTVKVFDNGSLLGSVTADAAGNWSFTPTTPLNNGPHDLTVVSTDKAGNSSQPSDTFTVVVDTVAPNKPVITQVIDDAGAIQGNLVNGQPTDDTTPTLKGQAEAGSTVQVFDKGNLLGSVVADAAGNWSFTPTTPLSNGLHDFTAISTDKAGNSSQLSNSFAVVVDTATSTPTITSVSDSSAPLIGNVASGGYTNDKNPTLSGKAEANSTVTIYDGVTKLGSTVADSSGDWQFKPTAALNYSSHYFSASSVDLAGNQSLKSNTYSVSVVESTGLKIELWEGTLNSLPQTGSVAQNYDTAKLESAINNSGVAASATGLISRAEFNARYSTAVKLSGYIYVEKGHTYTFNVPSVDDAVRLVVDGALILTSSTLKASVSGSYVAANSGFVSLNFYYLNTDGINLTTLNVSNNGSPIDVLGIGNTYISPTMPVAPSQLPIETSEPVSFAGFAYDMQTSEPVSDSKSDTVSASGELVTIENPSILSDVSMSNPAKDESRQYDENNHEQQLDVFEVAKVGSEPQQAVSVGDTDERSLLSDNEVIHHISSIDELDSVTFIESNRIDIIKMDGANMELDLSRFAGKVHSVEVFDITGLGNNTLKLSLADVLENGSKDLFANDGNVQIMVKGDASDHVVLDHLLSANGEDLGAWNANGNISNDGVTYNVYQHAGMAAEVLVQQGVQVDLV